MVITTSHEEGFPEAIIFEASRENQSPFNTIMVYFWVCMHASGRLGVGQECFLIDAFFSIDEEDGESWNNLASMYLRIGIARARKKSEIDEVSE